MNKEKAISLLKKYIVTINYMLKRVEITYNMITEIKRNLSQDMSKIKIKYENEFNGIQVTGETVDDKLREKIMELLIDEEGFVVKDKQISSIIATELKTLQFVLDNAYGAINCIKVEDFTDFENRLILPILKADCYEIDDDLIAITRMALRKDINKHLKDII